MSKPQSLPIALALLSIAVVTCGAWWRVKSHVDHISIFKVALHNHDISTARGLLLDDLRSHCPKEIRSIIIESMAVISPRRITDLVDELPEDHRFFAESLFLRGDLLLATESDTVAAERLIKRASERLRDDYRIWSWLADLYLIQQRVHEWRIALLELSRTLPVEDPRVLLQLTVPNRLNEPEAERHLIRFINDHPNDVHSLLSITEIRWRQGDSESAWSTLDRVLAIQPNLARAKIMKAKMLHESSNTTAAWKILAGLDEATLNDFPEALLLIANVELEQGRYKATLSKLERLQDRVEFRSAVAAYRGRSLLMLGCQEEGVAALSIARDLDSARQQGMAIAARVERNHGRFTSKDYDELEKIADTLGKHDLAKRWRQLNRDSSKSHEANVER